MKLETKQNLKQFSLKALSVVLTAAIVFPMVLLVVDLLSIAFLPSAVSFFSVAIVTGIYSLCSFGAYKLAKKSFNYLKDNHIIGQEKLKRDVKELCDTIDKLKELDKSDISDEFVPHVESLVDEIRPLEKIDETIDILSKMAKDNGIEFLLAKENRNNVVNDILELRMNKQVCETKIKEFKEIKEKIDQRRQSNIEKEKENNLEKRVEVSKTVGHEREMDVKEPEIKVNNIDEEPVSRGEKEKPISKI